MKYALAFFALCLAGASAAQVTDDFSDGDFTDNPPWQGDGLGFTVTEGQLNSMGPEPHSKVHLSTPNAMIDGATWEFLIDLRFAPSANNKTRAYLVSDRPNLVNGLNGYYIEIGQSGTDSIRFYREDLAPKKSTLLFTGSSALTGNVTARIQVTRSGAAEWQINADTSGEASFASEGAAFVDNTHTVTSFFGFVCFYSERRRNLFFFDEIRITAVAPRFGITSLGKEGNKSIRITFNQKVDGATAEAVTNYTLDYGFGNPVSAGRDRANLDEVLLTFADAFANNGYTLNIDRVQNQAMDETIGDAERAFGVELRTPFRNIVINELYANPDVAMGLPGSEFLELYNVSDQAIGMGGFEIKDKALGGFVLEAGGYVILTKSRNVADYSGYGEVIGLADSWNLANKGESLELRDNLGSLVDSVSYSPDWYGTVGDGTGYSLEQINPELACSHENNWRVSADAGGGTPGAQNNAYENTPDEKGPNLIRFIAANANTFLLTFDEPMDETSMGSATYTFDNGITENGISPISPGFLTAAVRVAPDLANGTKYTITLTGATDCAGNAIQTNSLSFAYDTDPPVLNRIVVRAYNKINVTFNEGLNKTVAEDEGNYSSDHSGANPTSAILGEGDETSVSLTFADGFVPGIKNTLTINNLEDLQGNTLTKALAPVFTLSQEVDRVRVMGINLLDAYFRQVLEPVSAGTTTNYSVSNGIGSPSVAFLDTSNDRLVHLAFANNFDDNKTLTLSISDIQNAGLDFLTTPDLTFVYDTSPPKLDTVKVVSPFSLEVVFTESVDEQSAESKENYEYDGIFPTQTALQTDRETIILGYEEGFERDISYELSIDEVKDLYGNEIKTKLKQEFVYDVFAPELDSIIVRSKNGIILWFNENVGQNIAENPANYLIGEGIGQPASASLDLEHQHIVYLGLLADLSESAGIRLDIATMVDQRGNTIAEPISSFFSYDFFGVATIRPTGRKTIRVEFNKPPDTSTKNTLANYSLNGQAARAVSFPENQIATLSFISDFVDDSGNTLRIENITDQNSNGLPVSEYGFDFDSRIALAGLVGDRTVSLVFEIALDAGQTLNLDGFRASPSLGKCFVAVIDHDNPGILRLTFEQSLERDIEYLVSWQNLVNTYHNVLPDYFAAVINDQTPPSVTAHLVVDANTIWIKYSELLNETSAEFLNNYHIAPAIGHATGTKYNGADSTVLLGFPSGFAEGPEYTLTINNIEDLSDNALMGHTIAFTFKMPNTPRFGDLIITEIMADPTPEVALPDAEYIEIYNTTDQTISLGGLSVVDEGVHATVVSGKIESGSYLILTRTSSVAAFSGSAAIGVAGFPSFNNSGEIISLYTGETQIFSTSYSPEWYKDSDKKGGGWALEMIDTDNPCGELNNWTASVNETGGTPGQANSVANPNPDNFGPQVLTSIALDESSIEIQMNEKLHPARFENSVISIFPEKTISRKELIAPRHVRISVTLAESLEAGQWYEITIDHVSDCKLNTIQSADSPITFRLPEEAGAMDLIINEVLFNPRDGGVDFVEIYNNSEKTVNLKNWAIGDKLNDPKIITVGNLALNPTEYLALTTDPAVLSANYPKGDASRFATMSSFPSLSDTEDSVILTTGEGLVIDQMKYRDDYHFNLLDDDDGVSLERISFEVESNNPDSWKSAASTIGFATPGKINSQYHELAQNPATISVEPKVFVPDNTGMNDFTTISYQMDQPGNFANVHIYSTHGVLIKTLAEGETLSTKGFFTWDGIANNGTRAAVGYYVVNFETFDGQGHKSVQKKTVVLGTRF